jgi:hypothetical protein
LIDEYTRECLAIHVRRRIGSRHVIEWLLELLRVFPTPALIARLSMEAFVQQAWHVVGRKVSKQRLLEDIYRTAQSSIGIPVEEDSEAVAMFRVVLSEMIRLCQLRDQLEQRAAQPRLGA